MPYVQASPRVRAGYAAPIFSAVAFVIASGLALDESPFREAIIANPRVAVETVEPAAAALARDGWRAGIYDTLYGRIALNVDGSAVATTKEGQLLREGTWRVTPTGIAMEWPTGSFEAAHEWWTPVASLGATAPPAPAGRAATAAATCGGAPC